MGRVKGVIATITMPYTKVDLALLRNMERDYYFTMMVLQLSPTMFTILQQAIISSLGTTRSHLFSLRVALNIKSPTKQVNASLRFHLVEKVLKLMEREC